MIDVWTRITDDNKAKIIQKAKESLRDIRSVIATRIAQELTGDTYYRFHRAFSPGMQEYVEARLLLSYCLDGILATPEALDEELRLACDCSELVFSLDRSDYVLGVADVTGELMRKAVAQSGPSGIRLHDDLCDIEHAMVTLSEAHNVGKDMASKMRVLHQSVLKVQKRCYDNAVRRAEVCSVTAGDAKPYKENDEEVDGSALKKRKHEREEPCVR